MVYQESAKFIVCRFANNIAILEFYSHCTANEAILAINNCIV